MARVSFSVLCRQEAMENFKFSSRDCCNISFLKGFFFRDNFSEKKPFEHRTDVDKSARAVRKLLSKYKITSSVSSGGPGERSTLTIDSLSGILTLQALLSENPRRCDRCAPAFFKGLFIGSGTVTDPDKEYHLEFLLRDEDRADRLCETLLQNGFEFKKGYRKGLFPVYTKNSRVIEDFLAYVGASNAFMGLVRSKVEKDLRNRVNRRTNCDMANIARSARARRRYEKAVEALKRIGGFDSLPDDVREVALLKIQNPELSLERLGKKVFPPLSKSSVSRRLAFLCDMADRQKNKS